MVNKMRCLLHILLLSMFMLGALGCGKPRFGPSFNDDRRQRNLPIIPADWVTGNVWSSETLWKSKNRDSTGGTSAHTGKKVAYSNGKRTWEEDYYYSGRTFDGSIIDPDSGTVLETMTVHYDYTAPEHPWSCYVVSDRHGGLNRIPLQDAERILESWGLTRLNYRSE